jgi:hypothetical protein
LAGWGEVDVAAVALKQRDSELGFEAADLLAERGLRDVQSLGRAAKMELLGDCDEVLDEPEVEAFHRRSLLIGGQLVLDFARPAAHSLPSNWAVLARLSSQPDTGPRCPNLDEVVQVPAASAMSVMRLTLSGEASRAMVDAAVAEANSVSVPVTVVVVDESGVTKEMLRMDGAPLVSVQTAIKKRMPLRRSGCPLMTSMQRSSPMARPSPSSARALGWRWSLVGFR